MKKGIIISLIFFFLSFSLFADEVIVFQTFADGTETIEYYSDDQIRISLVSRLRNGVLQMFDRSLEDIDSFESDDIYELESEENNERISMLEAYNSKDGACAFRALLGIAETRAGLNLTMDQLSKAREMYFGSSTSRNWWVTTRRSDGQTQGANYALEDVINIGLELLDSSERVIFIQRIGSPPNEKNIPAGTQATFISVRDNTSSTYHHFLEGDENGNMIYDPLHILHYFKTKTIVRFDAVRFYTPD